jgi:hypothetical protein
MKLSKLIFLFSFISFSFAQKVEKVSIPKGIVYNYCDVKTLENAKKLVAQNLSETNNYDLIQSNLIIGPLLWKSLKENDKIKKIKERKVEFHVDDLILEGKMSQDLSASKIIWDEFKKEISKDYIIRKANELELQYYWSVISFDIEEPLLIIETKNHNYILNILKKDLKLMWLDEAPKTSDLSKQKDWVIYQNGEEKDSLSKGIKETKLEKLILLNTDSQLKENTNIEDLTKITDKTIAIFEELFKNSIKPGKIMVEFELKKKDNIISFAVKEDIDLELMKEFKKRINNEKFPNSKKDSIKFLMLFKVNSYNDTE